MAVDDTPFGALVAPPPQLAAAPGADAPDVVMQLGRALHCAGSPANRIEEGMEAAARRLGLVGQFFSTPTALFASFGDEHGARRTILERVQPGEVNLERMSDLDQLLARLAAGALGPREAAAELQRFDRAGVRYGPALTTISFALVSGAAAQFLGGGAREIAAATALGLLIGGLASLAARATAMGRLFEPLAALLASFTATLAARRLPPLSVFLVMLAGIIVLVPGLTLTVAINDSPAASSSRAAPGSPAPSRSSSASRSACGTVGGRILVGTPRPSHPSRSASSGVPALVAAASPSPCCCARGPATPAGCSSAACWRSRACGSAAGLLGPQLGAFLGARLVGLGGNLYARVGHRPAG